MTPPITHQLFLVIHGTPKQLIEQMGTIQETCVSESGCKIKKMEIRPLSENEMK